MGLAHGALLTRPSISAWGQARCLPPGLPGLATPSLGDCGEIQPGLATKALLSALPSPLLRTSLGGSLSLPPTPQPHPRATEQKRNFVGKTETQRRESNL